MKTKFILTVLLIIINIGEVFPIPAFSRKYQTSCVTCHAVYPRLNPFGEAFRYDGYRFPKDDADQIKEEAVKLGAEAYKRVWPKAVWPSNIPGSVPIALRGRTGFIVQSHGDSSTTSEFVRPVLQLLAAANFGDLVSVFVGAHIFEGGEIGSLDRLFVRFNDLLKKYISKGTLNIRMGQFIPDIVPFASNHRGITNAPYSFNTYSSETGDSFIPEHEHGGGTFGIENFQLGMEASGIIGSRFRYVTGIVNGNGIELDNNSFRDFYGRVSYKIGGIGLDGSLKEGTNSQYEKSIAIGLFGYKGINTIQNSDIDFYRVGFDTNIWINKLNLVGGYIVGSDGMEDEDKYDLLFTDVYYEFYPWLTGLVRYEQANPRGSPSIRQIIPHISALVLANVIFKIETRIDINNPRFSDLYFGLDFAL
jgi:hypothetical protein